MVSTLGYSNSSLSGPRSLKMEVPHPSETTEAISTSKRAEWALRRNDNESLKRATTDFERWPVPNGENLVSRCKGRRSCSKTKS